MTWQSGAGTMRPKCMHSEITDRLNALKPACETVSHNGNILYKGGRCRLSGTIAHDFKVLKLVILRVDLH